MADFDPVGIAMSNATRSLAQRAVDSQQAITNQRNDTVFGQEQQSMSMGQRAQQMNQQKSEFDIVQNLRQQQMELQKNQSLAQVAAIQASTNERNLQAQNMAREMEQAPLKQDAANQMNQLLGSVYNVDALTQAQEKISRIPNAQLIPTQAIESAILNRKNQLLASTTFQNTQKQQADERETIVQAQNLGLDLSDFAKAGSGQLYDAYVNGGAAQIPPSQVFDIGALRNAMGQAQSERVMASEAFKSQLKTNEQLQVVGARNEGALAVAQQRAETAASRITNKADLSFYNEASKRSLKNEALLAATTDPETKARLLADISKDKAVMDQIGSKYGFGSESQSPEVTTERSSPKEMDGYKIGTTYAGGLTYLGGDPNDAKNWKK